MLFFAYIKKEEFGQGFPYGRIFGQRFAYGRTPSGIYIYIYIYIYFCVLLTDC